MVVDFALDRAIATVTLNSPANRNALSRQLVEELTGHLQDAAGRDDVRAVVLTHAGPTFCAGGDLKEQAAEGGPGESTKRVIDLLRLMLEMPKPVIAQVAGAVRGGGLGLVGAADIALAHPDA